MKTTIEAISDLTEQQIKELLIEIYERIPITEENLIYSAIPDKITRYVNESKRLSALEEAVTNYIVNECQGSQIGVQDPINFLMSSYRMLRHNLNEVLNGEV